MKSTLKRITCLILTLALVLSLTGTGLAAQADSADTSELAASAQSEVCAPEAAESTDAPAEPSEEPESAEVSADPEDEAGDDEVSADPESEAGEDQADAVPAAQEPETPAQEEPVQEEPAVIWWQVKAETYAEKASYLYNGKARKPACQLMREGMQVERKPEWVEQWYTDEACTVPATEFVNVGVRYLRLMEGNVIRAQGSYSIVKGKQSIQVKRAAVEQSFKKDKTFSLGAKCSGDGKLKYSSSDTNVVSVNKKGVCTMKKVGTATITVSAAETAHYKAATGKVQVKLYVRPRVLSYSSAYRSSRYYRALKKLQLTGSTGANAADIALSQLGYREGRSSSQLNGYGNGWNMSNWTEYGRHYGLNHEPWCAIFVNWCAREAGASYRSVPKYCAVRYYHSYFRRQGRFHSWSSIRSGSYRPKKGDIIIYAYSRGGVAHHIGYVLSSSAAKGRVKLTTVEGNTDDAVRKVSMNFSKKSSGRHGSHYILGVASPKW